LSAARGAPRGQPDERLFRAHFDNLPGPAYIFQRVKDDFVLVAFNHAAADVHFSRVADLLGKRTRDLVEATGVDLKPDLEAVAAGGSVIRREVEYRYIATHTLRRLAVSLIALSPDIVVMHTDDVTEQRRTEEALRESERKYRTIVDTAHEGVWAVDLESVTTYVNRRAADMIGYLPEEILGRSVFDFIDEALHPQALLLRQRRHTGCTEQFDFRLRHRDGSDVWISVSASPLTDDSGKIVGSLHMLADITARKRAEQAHRESEARLQALLDANPDLVVRVDRDGRHLDFHCSDAGRWGYLACEPAGFIGRTVAELFDADFARQHAYHRQRALTTGELQRWEYMRRADGAERYFEARFVKSGENEVVVTVRDITERVLLEREVIASTERERTRIGHDLHDGLAQTMIGVKLLLEALREKLPSGSAQRGDAENAAALVTRAIAEVGELAQGLSPIRKGGRLSDALRHLAQESQELLGVPCSVTSADVPAGLSESTATHLYRIAQEAITNAVKHGQAKHIELSCTRDRNQLVMRIADDGRGISVTSVDAGGMGMHIMRYRARSIGGDLAVERLPDRGTLVKCTCPLPA
jgi:two-component system CheB/CheR fusion protein